jgi:hypothetical protein
MRWALDFAKRDLIFAVVGSSPPHQKREDKNKPTNIF